MVVVGEAVFDKSVDEEQTETIQPDEKSHNLWVLPNISISIADDIERTVTIQLDGEEFTMEFLDALPWDDEVDHDIDVTADAYVVVYSVIDRVTFDAAVQSLYKLRHGLGTDRPIILVGNKIDLVRKRKLETSAALNHHVDELLVAIVKQIRHKLNPDVHPSPEGYTEPEMRKRDSKGATGFFVRLYRRLSRKGRPKGK
ncbi:REM1-like protein [Mya arenaria]|uniref:REM1-like protein n=1 Tax=Mya arenaria TaxID=6604 RepID=A0ABY7EWD0_MYAAR|nr:REM1-like protein [Mya arenaria]